MQVSAYYSPFFAQLFEELRASSDYSNKYRLQPQLQIGSKGHWQQLHRVNGNQFLVSFVKDSQVPVNPAWTLNQYGHPFRLEWSLDVGRKELFDRIQTHRLAINTEIGMTLDWERKSDRQRSTIALYYSHLNNDEARIEWVITYASRFIDVLAKYSQLPSAGN